MALDRQASADFMPSYPGLGSLQGAHGKAVASSPYLNFDPAYINNSGSEWIFPEGASKQRGRFELAFSQIGGAVMVGAAGGGIRGLYQGLRDSAIAGHTGAVKRTQVLNYITKGGSSAGNMLGVVAVMYSGFGVLLSQVRGTDDELNTVSAGALTGLLFKSTAGLRRCAIGGVIGASLATGYVLLTSRDKVRQML